VFGFCFYASANFSLSNLVVLLINKVILFRNNCLVLGSEEIEVAREEHVAHID
jgi:hypothetical protein